MAAGGGPRPKPLILLCSRAGQFGNRSAAFVRQAVALKKPFFAYIGTTGPHLPCIPAPWHMPTVAKWTNVTAPRLPTFNAHMPTHHPTIAGLPDLTPAGERIVDQQMRDRMGTLLSVDDLVAGVIHNLEQLAVLDKTYILFSPVAGPQPWPFGTLHSKIVTTTCLLTLFHSRRRRRRVGRAPKGFFHV